MATQPDVTAIVSQQLQDVGKAEFGRTASLRAEAVKRFKDWEDAVRIRSKAAIPDLLLFAPTIHPRLKIEKPFTVKLERSAECTTAYAEEIGEFGQGHQSGEALDDLGKTIAELYLALEEQAENLGPDLRAVRATLTQHIKKIRP